nr:tetratricopeptide repeat protein [uncultured Rhodopila sp.]
MNFDPAAPSPLPGDVPPSEGDRDPNAKTVPDVPDDPGSWLLAAQQARQNGRIREARRLLLAAHDRFPAVAQVLHDLARLAEAMPDWPEAERHWRAFSDVNPSVWWGQSHIAHALRRQDRHAEADAVLAAAMERFPHEAGVFADYARGADARRDWIEAEARWAVMTERFPNAREAWASRAAALRETGRPGEAEAVLTKGQTCCPGDARLFSDYARLAEIRRAWPEAAARWAKVAERFPALCEGLTGQARACRELGQTDQAHTLYIRALESFPGTIEPVHELARLAESLRNWPAAERWWRIAVALDPGFGWGWIGLARALREQGRDAETETVLLSQSGTFAQIPAFLTDYALVAERAGNWPEAEKRWQAVQQRFPDLWDGHAGVARMLRAQGRTDKARICLEAAAQRFPAIAAPLHDLARLAEMVRDWPAAERWWRASLVLDPGVARAYTGLASALREQGLLPAAEATLSGQFGRLGREPVLFVEYARLAELSKDWPEAGRRWENVLAQFPDVGEGYAGVARALREKGDLAAARDVLTTAAARFPNMLQPPIDLAGLAETEQDWMAAECWWRRVIALDGSLRWTYGRLANVLRESGRIDEADAVLVDQFAARADEPSIFVEYARRAERSNDWAAARERWDNVRHRFPDFADGYRSGANAILQAGALQEARALLIEALERFPGHAGLRSDLGRMAERRGDWVEAERQWQACLQLDAGNWRPYTALANALHEQGRHAEAATTVVDAIERFSGIPDAVADIVDQVCRPGGHLPDCQFTALARLVEAHASEPAASYRILTAHALLARERLDWAEYSRRLSRACEAAPAGHVRMQVLSAEANELLSDHDSAATMIVDSTLSRRYPFAPEADVSDRDLMASFESLGGGRGGLPDGGGTGGCEFGFVQRRYGAEPLSLLRWASVEPRDLKRALENRFAGLGDPDTTELQAISSYDWQVREKDYNINMDHTHLDRGKVGIEEAKAMVCKRFRFLSRKLMNDLAEGEKIFVYRLADASASENDIRMLAAAVHQYGKNVLLFVTKTNGMQEEFSFEARNEGLLLARIRYEYGDPFNPEPWLNICRYAFAAARGRRCLAAEA